MGLDEVQEDKGVWTRMQVTWALGLCDQVDKDEDSLEENLEELSKKLCAASSLTDMDLCLLRNDWKCSGLPGKPAKLNELLEKTLAFLSS